MNLNFISYKLLESEKLEFKFQFYPPNVLFAAVSASLISISLVQGLSWMTLLQMTSTNKAIVVQSLSPIPFFWDPMDCSPSGSSVHGISQAILLEWVAISFSRGSSWPRNRTGLSCLAGRLPLSHLGSPANPSYRSNLSTKNLLGFQVPSSQEVACVLQARTSSWVRHFCVWLLAPLLTRYL